MALFDIFKKRKEKERFDKKEKLKVDIPEETKEEKTGALKKASAFAGSKIIIKPHIAEKSTMLNEKGVYVFKVKPDANKVMVRQEIKKMYGKAPVKINIVNLPSKKVFIRGKHGVKSGFKKAVVYFKKGEKIEIT
ncbi:MAG: 50S ribosomal protein L23 [Candidatus Terrybacteria bacterium]|nr:50S ribosomal protein L23 [Candidatus Terrybacteria bacterium]